jgi:hypothetical protein
MQVREFLYFVLTWCLPYWMLRQKIRAMDAASVDSLWDYSWPLFRTTGKKLYAKLVLVRAFIQNNSHPAIQAALRHRFLQLTDGHGKGISADMCSEKINLMTRHA